MCIFFKVGFLALLASFAMPTSSQNCVVLFSTNRPKLCSRCRDVLLSVFTGDIGIVFFPEV